MWNIIACDGSMLTCIHLDSDGLPEGACRLYEEELVPCSDDCEIPERLPVPNYLILTKKGGE